MFDCKISNKTNEKIRDNRRKNLVFDQIVFVGGLLMAVVTAMNWLECLSLQSKDAAYPGFYVRRIICLALLCSCGA